MSLPLLQIVQLTLIPALATVLGGVVAALRPPGEQSRSFVQHFAAGVVFAAVAGELLPEITKEHQPIAVVIGFALGLLTLLGLRRFTQTLEKGVEGVPARSSAGLLATVALDVALDGVLIGLGFAAGERVGTLLLVALTLELLFLGLSVAASLAKGGASRGRVIGTVTGLALLVPLFAVLAAGLLGGTQGFALELLLSFGAAALLYLVTEELLVEAHEVPETPLLTAAFFIGFLALFLIEMSL